MDISSLELFKLSNDIVESLLNVDDWDLREGNYFLVRVMFKKDYPIDYFCLRLCISGRGRDL